MHQSKQQLERWSGRPVATTVRHRVGARLCEAEQEQWMRAAVWIQTSRDETMSLPVHHHELRLDQWLLASSVFGRHECCAAIQLNTPRMSKGAKCDVAYKRSDVRRYHLERRTSRYQASSEHCLQQLDCVNVAVPLFMLAWRRCWQWDAWAVLRAFWSSCRSKRDVPRPMKAME